MGWVCAICGSSNAPFLRQCVCSAPDADGDATDASIESASLVAFAAADLAEVVALASKPKAKPKNKNIRSYDADGWVAFWASYPLRLDKGKAYDAFCAAVDAGVDADSLIAAAQRYASWCRINDVEQRHIKYAQGWINSERWNDELDIPAAAGESDPAYIVGTPEYAARVEADERRVMGA